EAGAGYCTHTPATAGAAMAIASCSSNSTNSNTTGGSKPPVTVGISLSLTGDFSADGQAFQRGYNLWASYIDSHGGLIDGRPVKVSILNANTDPTPLQAKYTKL